MPLKWSAEMTITGAQYSTSAMNTILRTAFVAAGEHWHAKFRERHFTNRAFALYGYLPRAKGYWARKKKLGLARPLVFSGQSERRSESATIVGKKSKGQMRAEVRMNVPTLNRRHAKSKINMRKELTTIAPSEHIALGKVLGVSLRKQMRSARNRVRVKIGGV